jgi:hypothetical protein
MSMPARLLRDPAPVVRQVPAPSRPTEDVPASGETSDLPEVPQVPAPSRLMKHVAASTTMSDLPEVLLAPCRWCPGADPNR